MIFFILNKFILNKYVNISFKEFILYDFIYIFLNFLIFFKYRYSYNYLIYFIFFNVLFLSSITDLKKLFVPDIFIFIGIISIFIIKFYLKTDLIYYIKSAFICFFILYIIFLLSNKNLGGADVKLYFLIGLIFGYEKALMSLFYSCFLATVLNFNLLFNKNINKYIPMIPYISIICYIFLLI